MEDNRHFGRPYKVSGANAQTGEEVELTVRGFDEADARRTANRQGVYVSGGVPASGDGSGWADAAPRPPAAPDASDAPDASGRTFSQAVAEDAVVRRLVKKFPDLKARFRWLNADDERFLSNLVGHVPGVSHRESAHVARVIQENRHLPRE